MPRGMTEPEFESAWAIRCAFDGASGKRSLSWPGRADDAPEERDASRISRARPTMNSAMVSIFHRQGRNHLALHRLPARDERLEAP